MYASFVCVSPLMAWLYGLLSVPRDDGHGDGRREGLGIVMKLLAWRWMDDSNVRCGMVVHVA